MTKFTYALGKVRRPAIIGAIAFLCLGASIATAIADEATSTNTAATSTVASIAASSSVPLFTAKASSTTASSTPGTASTSTTQSVTASAVATSSPVVLPSTPWVTPGYTLLSAVASTATSTNMSINCNSAYTADLYDTPTGHLDGGYILATSSSQTGVSLAHIVGTQSWANCRDSLGNIYEIKLTPTEYAALGQPGVKMPKKSLTLASASPVTSAPVTTGPTSSSAEAEPTTSSTTQSIVSPTITAATTTPSTNISTTTPSN